MTNPILQGGLGAYSTFVTAARDKDDFFQRATLESRKLGLEVEQVVWSEPLDRRLARHGIEAYLLHLAEEVRAEGGNRFGKFHAWDQGD